MERGLKIGLLDDSGISPNLARYFLKNLSGLVFDIVNLGLVYDCSLQEVEDKSL